MDEVVQSILDINIDPIMTAVDPEEHKLVLRTGRNLVYQIDTQLGRANLEEYDTKILVKYMQKVEPWADLMLESQEAIAALDQPLQSALVSLASELIDRQLKVQVYEG